jgi:hypothetical protein
MTEDQNYRIIELAKESKLTASQMIDDLINNNCIAYDPELKVMVPTALGCYAGCFDPANMTTLIMKLHNADKYEVFISYHDGNLLKFYKCRLTGEVTFDMDCLAKGLGYSDVHELLSQDSTLDEINECLKVNGQWPIKID